MRHTLYQMLRLTQQGEFVMLAPSTLGLRSGVRSTARSVPVPFSLLGRGRQIKGRVRVNEETIGFSLIVGMAEVNAAENLCRTSKSEEA